MSELPPLFVPTGEWEGNDWNGTDEPPEDDLELGQPPRRPAAK
jgi:hypothetical protein